MRGTGKIPPQRPERRKLVTRTKKVLRGVAIAVCVLAVLLVILLIYLTVNEYNPPQTEAIGEAAQGTMLSEGSSLRVMTLNTGYAGLSEEADFFMDGGTGVHAKSAEQVASNLNGIVDMMAAADADAYLLQEVDINSDRTWNVNEAEVYELQTGMDGRFAYNYNCAFVPYPVPMIGHVESGVLTLTDLAVESAQRVQLPVSFSWPVSTCNLKRCLLVERIPLSGTEKELVLVNLHLEAYDEGDGKIAQTKMLNEILEAEYQKGNYVIAGGDFNQTFEGIKAYPDADSENWAPGRIAQSEVPDGFSFAVDGTVPTCRLLSAPYTGSYETSQVYVIDGFIVSDNVEVTSVETQDFGFRYTDHQPVVLNAALKKS